MAEQTFDPESFEEKEAKEKRALLNNFWMKLPGVRDRGYSMGIPVVYSEKRAAQTDEQFFETIDREAIALGINLKRTEELVGGILEFTDNQKYGQEQQEVLEKYKKPLRELDMVVEPLFRRLLEMGYTADDLR